MSVKLLFDRAHIIFHILDRCESICNIIIEINARSKKESEIVFSIYPEMSIINYSLLSTLFIEMNKLFIQNGKDDDYSFQKILSDLKESKILDKNGVIYYQMKFNRFKGLRRDIAKLRNKVYGHTDESENVIDYNDNKHETLGMGTSKKNILDGVRLSFKEMLELIIIGREIIMEILSKTTTVTGSQDVVVSPQFIKDLYKANL